MAELYILQFGCKLKKINLYFVLVKKIPSSEMFFLDKWYFLIQIS